MKPPPWTQAVGNANNQNPLLGEIKVMTHNCNGLLTRVGERHKEELRMDLVLRFAKKNRVPVIAIQEPHINSSQKLEFATKRFKKKATP